jgi:hypothetical protein
MAPGLADEENNNISFTLSPNPSGGTFILFNPFDEEYSLNVINNLGVAVYQGKVHRGENEMGMKQIPPGIYQLHLLSTGGNETVVTISVMQ